MLSSLSPLFWLKTLLELSCEILLHEAKLIKIPATDEYNMVLPITAYQESEWCQLPLRDYVLRVLYFDFPLLWRRMLKDNTFMWLSEVKQSISTKQIFVQKEMYISEYLLGDKELS